MSEISLETTTLFYRSTKGSLPELLFYRPGEPFPFQNCFLPVTSGSESIAEFGALLLGICWHLSPPETTKKQTNASVLLSAV